LAYLYTKFAKENYHGKNPYPTRLLFVDEALYVWKFAEAHAAASFYTGRMDEAKANYKEILEAMKTHPQCFSEEDIKKVQMNGQFFNK
jgi:effector-binding domain-containing protein